MLAPLTQEQADIYGRMEDFLDDPDTSKRQFVCHGLAGTGKTHILAHLARSRGHARVCALCGRAAFVLTNRIGVPAMTIHQAMYTPAGEKIEHPVMPVLVDADGNPLPEAMQLVPPPVTKKNRDLLWTKQWKPGDLIGEEFFLDECSQINEWIGNDILLTGAKVVAFGDPGQLPPVKGAVFFNSPDAVLQTVHRQALESGIIRQAYNMRYYGEYRPDGADFQVTDYIPANIMLGADIVLCWTNNTRMQINHLIRSYKGIAHLPPQRGEPMMCLMNNKDYGVFNGAMYELAEDYVPYSNKIWIHDGAETHCILKTYIEGLDDMGGQRRPDKNTTPFAFGYAATVHKFQGSEANNVIFIDECFKNDIRRQLNYTAFTRACRRIIVCRT